jgi:hypothetical protein
VRQKRLTFLVYPDQRRRLSSSQICLYGRPARKDQEAIQEERAIEQRTMVVKCEGKKDEEEEYDMALGQDSNTRLNCSFI